MSISFLSLILFVGCNETSEDSNAQLEQAAPAEAPVAKTTVDGKDQSENPFEQNQVGNEQAPSMCPDDAGLSCAGSLQIRAVNAALSKDRNAYILRGSLQLKNTRSEPIQLAFVHTDSSIRLSNGAAFKAFAHRAFPGRKFCSDSNSAEECYARAPNYFTLLESGDSPIEVNFEYQSQRIEASLVPSMADVTSGTMNFSVITVDASGAQRRRDISINDIPIDTRIGT